VVAGSNPVAPTNSSSRPAPKSAGRTSRLLLLLAIAGVPPILALALRADSGAPLGRSQPQHGACGSSLAVDPAGQSGDTLFTRWHRDANDSGYYMVEVSRGDTLSLYLQWITDVNPHLRIWGPMGATRHRWPRVWRINRLKIQNEHEIFETSVDITTQGANSRIGDIELRRILDTPDSICWEQRWRFVKAVGRRDTIGVVRRTLVRKGEPYFLVRYELTWLGQEADSVRFIWSSQPRVGTGGSKYDVGFAPGYGLVTRQRAFDAAPLDWCALMLDIGNPGAAQSDTLAGGRPAFMSPELKADFGSGTPSFIAGFVCFNPEAGIVPSEFVWMDSTGAGESALDFDSPRIAIDTTKALEGTFRDFVARTQPVSFIPGQTLSFEYAIGRASLAESLPPVVPEVIWFDGSVWSYPVSQRH
jgi:hypothetical protein